MEYTCTEVSKLLNCSGKTIRKWAGILFNRGKYPLWLFSEKQIKILKEYIKKNSGRPKIYDEYHHKTRNINYTKKYNKLEENKRKIRAKNVVFYALKKNKIKRPTNCSMCSKICKPLAHHEDYSKPLEIVWICKSCHNKIHKNTKQM